MDALKCVCVCIYILLLLLLLGGGGRLAERLVNTTASRKFNEFQRIDLLSSFCFSPLPTSLSSERTVC